MQLVAGDGSRRKSVEINLDGQAAELGDGSIVVASITSCTNTSNPSVMLAAGLVAKKASAAKQAPPVVAAVVEEEEPPKPKPPTRKVPAAKLAKIEELLLEKRRAPTQTLGRELDELVNQEKGHRSDLEEIASEANDHDSVCEIMDNQSSQIGQIDTALQKIAEGSYGVCEDCGGEIAWARMEALPFASQCIECKRKAEIAGEFSQLL